MKAGQILPYVLATVALGALVFMGVGSSTGDRIASAAEAAVGMGATADAQAFGDWLGGDGETENMKMSMASAPQSSTCGLAVRAEWRIAGVDDPYLQPPYAPRIGMVITDLIDFAKQKGAWVQASPDALANTPPKRGSMVAIGPQGDISHVYTVTGVTDNGGGSYTVESVDGGMTDQYGKQMVGSHVRTWTVQGNVIVDAPNNSIARVVYGWVDPDLLG